MPPLDPQSFDPAKPLAMGRFNTVGGHALAIGDPITIVPEGQEPEAPGEVTVEAATRLWAGGTFVYAEHAHPTPVESLQDAAARLLAVDDLGGGRYLIRLPWLPNGSETVEGKEALDARKAELIEAGQPTDFDPNTAASMAAANAGSTDTGAVDERTATDTEARVQALVEGNSERQLRAIITDLDKARAAAAPPQEPLGARSDHDKADLARLIVSVDGDASQPAGGTGEAGSGDTGGGKAEEAA
jgi:hypothetical protein